jgi:hypothetical protein
MLKQLLIGQLYGKGDQLRRINAHNWRHHEYTKCMKLTPKQLSSIFTEMKSVIRFYRTVPEFHMHGNVTMI